MAIRHRKQPAAATIAPSLVETFDSHDAVPNITVLRELPVYLRWDVAPWILLYGTLICMDDRQSWISTMLFTLALVSHMTLILVSQWSWSLRSMVGYQRLNHQNDNSKDWTHCFVQSADQGAGIVKVSHVSDSIVTFCFHDCVYRYCSTPPDLDVTLWHTNDNDRHQQHAEPPRFRPVRYPVQHPISFFTEWKGHSNIKSCKDAQSLYGMNSTVLSLPSFVHLLSEQLVAPFFIFQLFCVALWSLDEYWMYALFTLFALVLFESTIAYNRLLSLQRLDSVSHRYSHQRIWVHRMGHSMSILIQELLPGDIVRLSNGMNVPADIVLTKGTAVCDEALLTGESIPQRKNALDDTSEGTLDIQTLHKESILFGGTSLVTADPGDDGRGVTGIVLRTGFATAQGNLLRTMAHTSNRTDAVHTRDTFLFILLLLVCAVGAAGFVLQNGWYDDRRNRFRLILHVIILITSVVPPELPLELSLAITNSVATLAKQCQVHCTEHFRIAWAGEVTVCCFDKTGTLTSDTMLVKGIRLFSDNVPSENDVGSDEDDALEMDPSVLPWETVRVMVACQSLATTGRSVVGDPLERAVLEHSGYGLIGNDSVGPKTPDDGRTTMAIHHNFDTPHEPSTQWRNGTNPSPEHLEPNHRGSTTERGIIFVGLSCVLDSSIDRGWWHTRDGRRNGIIIELNVLYHMLND